MCESFPVIRTGRLAAANDARSNTRVIATYDQSEQVLEIFNKKSTTIENNLLDTLKENISGFELVSPENNPFPDQVKLQTAQRSRSFSPIFDFSDHLIRCDNILVLIRACVTVCTAEKVLGFAPNNAEDHRSKFWTRIACVAIDGTLATDVSDTELRSFENLSIKISNISNNALCAPYQDAFSKAVKKNVKIDLKETFTFFAIGSDDQSFDSFYEELRDGSSFRDLMNKNAAERLIEVASLSNIFPGTSPQDPQVLLNDAANNEDMQLFIFEDNRHYRGVFIGKKETNSAYFIGITHFPNFSIEESSSMYLIKNNLRQQPSVRVSAQAINEIAIRL